MAQAEDTELRDLVVEALEKNGSLAKIRALLRANIFLIFEDDCENVKQNVNLDSLLKLPEESRQGKDYSYEGHNSLFEKLKLSNRNNDKEPLLVTLIKNVLRQQTNSFGHNVKRSDKHFNEEQNNTYIVHEDSVSSVSHSNSDNSSDEKNKLHLRLQLDNSDTDTSSDSTRDKTSSEYIPSEHILIANESPPNTTVSEPNKSHSKHVIASKHSPEINKISSNSESTSYVDIKPLSTLDKILINTSGVPTAEEKSATDSTKSHTKTELTPAQNLLNNYNSGIKKNVKQKSDGSGDDLTEYSLDFTSPASGIKDSISVEVKSPKSLHDHLIESSQYNHKEQHYQKSNSSQSLISISDAADVMSDISNSSPRKNNERSVSQNTKSKLQTNHTKIILIDNNKSLDDSCDFSESPIPSLSNLSLDIHSD